MTEKASRWLKSVLKRNAPAITRATPKRRRRPVYKKPDTRTVFFEGTPDKKGLIVFTLKKQKIIVSVRCWQVRECVK